MKDIIEDEAIKASDVRTLLNFCLSVLFVFTQNVILMIHPKPLASVVYIVAVEL